MVQISVMHRMMAFDCIMLPQWKINDCLLQSLPGSTDECHAQLTPEQQKHVCPTH
jgi:hypothetical protein